MKFRLVFLLRTASSTAICFAVTLCYCVVLSIPEFQSFLAKLNVTKVIRTQFPPPVSYIATNHVCVNLQGRLGNNLFQYATVYGIAKQHNFSIIMAADDILFQYFNISSVKIASGRYICDSFEKVLERSACCTFDPSLMDLRVDRNYRIGDWLQSWKYFRHVFSEIRQQFTFKEDILDTAEYIVDNLRYSAKGKATMIGIHMRYGDMLKKRYLQDRGYRMAPDTYTHNAIDFMLSRHENVVFIVCSDDINEAKKAIGDKTIDVYFFSISPAQDMAILSTCDHVIMTVGTFGWWAGFLSNGTVVYYKHPHIPGSEVWTAHNYNDFYPPNWIGLE